MYSSEDKESKNIHQLLNSLEVKQQEVATLQKNISDIKQHGSELQTFFSMKRIEKEVSDKEEYIRSVSGSENLKNIVLSFHINTAIINLISDIQNFGKITVKSKPSGIKLTTRKQNQAQMMVTKEPSRSFENINLQLQQTINTKQVKSIFGTCLLPDGRIVFSRNINRFSKGTITVLNTNGSLDFEVGLPLPSFDVAYITEDNTLAVSSGHSGSTCIYIVDMQNQRVKKTISVNDYVFGITNIASKLVCAGNDKGIRIINPSDETISDVVGGIIPGYCYVTNFGNKLYHTNPSNNTVTCYDLKGNKEWAFENKSVLQTPAGICVDSSGNIYEVGRTSNNVILISADGKRHRQLLSGHDGLSEPWAIHFSKERNTLIVANRERAEAFLNSVN